VTKRENEKGTKREREVKRLRKGNLLVKRVGCRLRESEGERKKD
jgi:hypothetical protein